MLHATPPATITKPLGASGIDVSPLGLGCWPIGGEMQLFGRADSYGKVDDVESIRAIQAAVAAGVTFFDTADCYGGGHSETVLGRALREVPGDIVVATKAGYVFDEQTRNIHGESHDPAYYRAACEASLRRLGRDVIDLYQVHLWSAPVEAIGLIVDALEQMKAAGLIRAYGWSTDHLDTARAAIRPGGLCTLQHEFSVFHRADEALRFCHEHHLGSIARLPLAMGLLSGKYRADTAFTPDDVRGSGFDWVRYFKEGKPVPEFLARLESVREILGSGGRTLAQGALAYIWGKSSISVPIPGFRNMRQAVENARAMQFGPLSTAQVAEIDATLDELAAK
jgi:aryl-alcohol dehydrogenase-like predicted oxidoreductase